MDMDYVFILNDTYEESLVLTRELMVACPKVKAVTITNHTIPPFICIHTVEALEQNEYDIIKLEIEKLERRLDN